MFLEMNSYFCNYFWKIEINAESISRFFHYRNIYRKLVSFLEMSTEIDFISEFISAMQNYRNKHRNEIISVISVSPYRTAIITETILFLNLFL